MAAEGNSGLTLLDGERSSGTTSSLNILRAQRRDMADAGDAGLAIVDEGRSSGPTGSLDNILAQRRDMVAAGNSGLTVADEGRSSGSTSSLNNLLVGSDPRAPRAAWIMLMGAVLGLHEQLEYPPGTAT